MMEPIVQIETAKIEAGHVLCLRFNDGVYRSIDFAPFLSRSQHSDIRSFMHSEKFATFRLEHGDLVWGDYDLCFPVADLFAGRI